MKNKTCENCQASFKPEMENQTFCMKCLKIGNRILEESKLKKGYREPDGEEYAKIKEMHRGYQFMYMKVYQLIDVLIKKGVITIEDLNGYKKLKDLKNQEKELDIKYGRKYW